MRLTATELDRIYFIGNNRVFSHFGLAWRPDLTAMSDLSDRLANLAKSAFIVAPTPRSFTTQKSVIITAMLKVVVLLIGRDFSSLTAARLGNE